MRTTTCLQYLQTSESDEPARNSIVEPQFGQGPLETAISRPTIEAFRVAREGVASRPVNRGKDAPTVLELGMRGKGFALVGRTVLRATSGGVWNEWAMERADGTFATLAEARGTFTVFEESATAPAWETNRPGVPFDAGYVVVERGEAERVARAGDAGDAPKRYRYVDLSGRDGSSATIDYGESPPKSYVGRRVTLASLGLSPRKESPRFIGVSPVAPPKGLSLWLDVGDEGVLEKVRWRVIAILHRTAKSGGEKFSWQEYVLFEAAHGLRFLVVSDGHWSLVTSIEPGQVEISARGARYDGDDYKPLGTGTARLEWATGALPWEATIGEVVETRDYIHAPYMLSCEVGPDEVNWARGEWIETAAVARAFGKRVLPKPEGRAPHQPKRSTGGKR